MTRQKLSRAIEALGQPRVLIVGDLILDRYVTGEVERISPEAPIPVLAARHSQDLVGGAGNVAANLRAMEAEVEVLGVVGDDSRGARLRALLEELGVGTSGCLVDPSRPTTEKTRMISGVQQILRVDWESSSALAPELGGRLVEGLRERVRRAGAVVLSDYGKGVLSEQVLRAAIAEAREAGVPVLVDPKGADFLRYRGATLVTPNRREAELAVGRRLPTLEDVTQGARELLELAQLEAAVITLGGEGMFHMQRGGPGRHTPTVARAVFDVTGAGDTVIAHLALGLAGGLPLALAAELANHAAGIVVGKRGAASVTRAELLGALAEGDGGLGGGKLLEGAALDEQVAAWRAQGRRVVFTNGCFDVLHAGHVAYLRFARSKGDVLLVGVNDDASVRRLKGVGRPVNSLADRLEVLAALEVVDAVAAFGEDTPERIVQRVTPNVLVKGEDWRDKGVVGREWVESHGGEVVLAPLLEGRSTSAILERGGGPPRSSAGC
jgi:D-beta-D-heptose 7-phosphate kinase/D-beta-D-heptose 1-phosphate adenosyltransferase